MSDNHGDESSEEVKPSTYSELDKIHACDQDKLCCDHCIKPDNKPIVSTDVHRLNYDMSKKGHAVIFNQINCAGYEKRFGTEEDAKSLKKCLTKLNFVVDLYDDLSHSRINEVMEEVVEIKDISCLLIVLMTHGEPDGRVSARDAIYRVSTLWKMTDGQLRGIPKLFFIQACRGDGIDDGFDNTMTDSKKTGDIITPPLNADMLLMFSSSKGFYSYREKEGSWFITELCKAFEKHADSLNLLELLTIVNYNVSIKYSTRTIRKRTNNKKQMPEIVSTLTKFLKFNKLNVQ